MLFAIGYAVVPFHSLSLHWIILVQAPFHEQMFEGYNMTLVYEFGIKTEIGRANVISFTAVSANSHLQHESKEQDRKF